jgi:hypothetical protein
MIISNRTLQLVDTSAGLFNQLFGLHVTTTLLSLPLQSIHTLQHTSLVPHITMSCHYTTCNLFSPWGVSSSVRKGMLTGGKEIFIAFLSAALSTSYALIVAMRCFSIHSIINPTPRYVAAAQLHAADDSHVLGLYSSSSREQPSHSSVRCLHRPVQMSY